MNIPSTPQADAAERFRQLHLPGTPLLLPNAWDVGSAKLFASLGFSALATTSAGFAFTIGRGDYEVTGSQTLGHAAEILRASSLPVSADLENGFADDAAGVALTVEAAVEAGLAGCSIEDHTGDPDNPIYEFGQAVDRVAAAVEAAHRGPVKLVLTARADNHFHGRTDLEDTIARLQAYARAGADCVYAPGLVDAAQIGRVVKEVDAPVNILALPGGPTVKEAADLGVARISVGSAFALAAVHGAALAAAEFQDRGTLGFWQASMGGLAQAHAALQVPDQS